MTLRFSITLAAVLVSAIAALTCNYLSTVFSTVGNCSNEKCGLNCYITGQNPETFQCYQSGNACCGCQSYTYTCQCTFPGGGTGRFTSRLDISNSICDPDTGKCSGYRYKPLGFPTEA